MNRQLTLVLVVGLLAVWPLQLEAGQGGLFGPAVEVGADVAVGVPDVDLDEIRSAFVPRVTLHLTPHNSLVFFGDAAATRTEFADFDYAERTQMVGAGLRRALFQSGGFTTSALVGIGLSRRQIFRPEYILPGRDGPTVIPAGVGTSYQPMFSMGVSLERRLTNRLSVHGDVLVIGSNGSSEVRAQTGFSVPLRPYSSVRAAESRDYGATALRTGQKVWIGSSTGTTTEGTIDAIDRDHIELMTQTGRVSFARTDIRRIAVPDSLRNGTLLGATIGAAALGGFVAAISGLLCESNDCDNLAPTLVGAGYGAGFGAITGALIDSLIDRSRTVFGSESGLLIAVTPTLSRRQAGAKVQFNW